MGGSSLAADVLLHAVDLLGGHVELVVARILQQQILALDSLGAQLVNAAVEADAVADVNDVVAFLEVEHAGDRDALVRGLARAVHSLLAEDLRVGEHHQPGSVQLVAGPQGRVGDVDARVDTSRPLPDERPRCRTPRVSPASACPARMR